MRYDIIEIARDNQGKTIGNQDFYILQKFYNNSEETIFREKHVCKTDDKTMRIWFGDNPDFQEYISRNEELFPNEVIAAFNWYCDRYSHKYGNPIHSVNNEFWKQMTFKDGMITITLLIRRLKSLEAFDTHMNAFNENYL